MWQQLKLAGHVFRLNARQAFFNKAAAWATILLWCVRMGLTILLYQGVYQALNTTEIKGTDFYMAASSMLLYALFSVFGARDLFRQIHSDHQTGSMGIWLNRPISYLFWQISSMLGQKSLVIIGMFFVLVAYFLAGFMPDVSNIIFRVLSGTILLFLGVAINMLIYSLVGLSAVWLHDPRSVWMVLDKTVMIFGGAYLPITFFPPLLRLVGEILPMGAVSYVTQIFYIDFWDNLPRFIVTQVVWLFILFWAIKSVLRAMNKNLTLNGG